MVPANSNGDATGCSAWSFTTAASTGTPVVSTFKTSYTNAQGIIFDNDNNMYISRKTYISKITAAGDESTYATGLGNGSDMAFDKSGNLYCIDYSNSKVYKIAAGGGTASNFATTASPVGIVYDNIKDVLYVTNYFACTISKISMTGSVSVFATISGASRACGLTMDKDSNLYTTDFMGKRVYEISKSGNPSALASATSGYVSIEYMPSGILLVTDYTNNKIMQITTDGTTTKYAGTGVAATTDGSLSVAQFNQPYYAAVDKQGNYYVTEYTTNNIRKISAGKSISISAPSGDYLAWGNPFTFKFNTQGIDSVNIDYSVDGGTTWNPIASHVKSSNGLNSLQYTLPVGNGWLYNCKLRISDAADSNNSSTSNFTLKDKSIVINSPKGGETYNSGDTIKISYTTSENLGYVYFQISYDGGSTWTAIDGSNYSYTIGTYNYNYITPIMSAGSANCKVKAYYYYPNSSGYYGISAGTFTIKSAPPTIIVTSPSSTDLLKPGNKKYIYWTSYLVKNVNIYYSTDNGSHYTSIAQGIASGDSYSNYYYWTVPTVSGYFNQAKIKIESASDNTVKNTSNTFTITDQSPVVVTSPVRGNKWYAGSTGTISYKNRSNQSLSVYAYLSSDSLNWNYIGYGSVNSLGIGSITYSIPVLTTGATTYRVRLYDYSTYTYSIPSDAFEIVAAPAQLSIASPVKGNYLKSGSSNYITWTSISAGDNVKIEYTTNGGSDWSQVVASTGTSNGYENSYNWVVPSTIKGIYNNCLIRITSNSDSKIVGISDIFTISDKDQLQVTYPDSLVNVTAGNDLTIRYINNGASQASYFYIYYSINGGSSWNYYSATYFYGLPSGENSYIWTVPTSLTDNKAVKIAISNSSYYPTSGTLYGISKAFNVTGLPAVIKVKSPVAGDYFTSGTNRYITWSSLHSSSVKIEYRIDNGTTWNTISSSYYSSDNDNNSYYWNVGSIAGGSSDQCQIRITDYNKPSLGDSSELFTISNKSQLAIVTPNGGETLKAGEASLIQFNNKGTQLNTNVYLYYTLNNGSWNYITSFYSVPGGLSSYTWNVPATLSDSNRYRLIIYENYYATSDTSNTFFTINGATPSIKVTSPAYGNVLWSKDNGYVYYNIINVKAVDLDYSLDGGTTWTNYVKNQTVSGKNYMSWVIPTVSGIKDNCIVKIHGTKDSTIYGLSGVFTIKDGTVNYTISNPNGGEVLKAGTYNSIVFNNTGKSSYASLAYSTNGGSTFNTITSIYTYYGLNTYSWYIPDTTSRSKTWKVRIIDGYNTTIGDTSNANFAVAEATPYITVASPTGGSWWVSGNNYLISWSSLNVKRAIVELSTDGGLSWSALDTLMSNVNGYNTDTVKAPPVGTTSYSAVIRVKNAYSFKTFGLSSIFSISKAAPALTVLSPNGGETYTAGNNMPISFNNEGPATYAVIKLSTDNGFTWNYISDYLYAYSGKNSTSYYLPYYSNGSTKALIEVEPYSSSIHSPDTSNAVFTIKAVSPFISITSPGAYNLWWSGDSHYLYWNSAHVSSVSLYYSIDTMKSWNKIVEHYSTIDGTNSYNWTVPVITGKVDKSYVKIVSDNDATVNGTSNLFTIDNEATKIIVVSPNGGETFNANNYVDISYQYSGRPRSYVTVYLSTDSGKTKTSIGQGSSVYSGLNTFSYFIPKDTKTSKQCFVYVEEGYWDNPAIHKSDAIFTIKAVPPSINSVYASDNYIVAGKAYSINWYSYKAAKVNIDYSTDNGKTWSSLIAGISSPDGNNNSSFVTPAVSGTFEKSYFRVSSAYNKTISSNSGILTLSDVPISYTVISPNGGEKLKAGNTYTVSLSKTGPVNYSSMYISLSTDGGNSYQYIGYAYFGSNNKADFNWTIDNLISSKYCKIKAQLNYNDSVNYDVSDNLFEIQPAPAQISISLPTASSYWVDSTLQKVYWNSVSVQNTKVQYSMDAGSTWTNLANNVNSANGSNILTIEVPGVDSTVQNAKVRVVDLADTNVYGVSQSFIISPSAATLTVIKPNGGEVLKSGSSYFIEYSYVGKPLYGAVVYYSTNGGRNWVTLGKIGTIKEGKYSFEWEIPADITISNYNKIMISSADGSFTDITDGLFSIVPGKSELSITLPNSYNYAVAGNSQSIIWNARNVDAVNIDYSLDAGATWNSIATNVSSTSSSNTYDWTVPSISGTFENAKVRITNASNSDLSVISESFVISDMQRSLKIIDPNGANTLYAGKYYDVKFQNNGLKTTVNISIFNSDVPNGSYLCNFENIKTGNNIIEVKIPETLKGNDSSFINITDYYNYQIKVFSDTAFSLVGIDPVIKNVKPDSTAYWSAGDSRTISWKSYNIDSVILSYSIDGGTTWSLIDDVAAMNGNNTYNWTVADVKKAKVTAQIKVSSSVSGKISGLSGKFTLTGNPVVLTITSPNGGGTIKAGIVDTIKFKYTANDKIVNAYISFDKGSSWSKLGSNSAFLGDNKMAFWLPFETVPSTQCLVRIEDEDGIADTSNAVFAVAEADPAISIESPDTGDYWIAKSVHSVAWFSWKVSKVNLEYSKDNGKTWF